MPWRHMRNCLLLLSLAAWLPACEDKSGASPIGPKKPGTGLGELQTLIHTEGARPASEGKLPPLPRRVSLDTGLVEPTSPPTPIATASSHPSVRVDAGLTAGLPSGAHGPFAPIDTGYVVDPHSMDSGTTFGLESSVHDPRLWYALAVQFCAAGDPKARFDALDKYLKAHESSPGPPGLWNIFETGEPDRQAEMASVAGYLCQGDYMQWYYASSGQLVQSIVYYGSRSPC
jgi:hypothetical protein